MQRGNKRWRRAARSCTKRSPSMSTWPKKTSTKKTTRSETLRRRHARSLAPTTSVGLRRASVCPEGTATIADASLVGRANTASKVRPARRPTAATQTTTVRSLTLSIFTFRFGIRATKRLESFFLAGNLTSVCLVAWTYYLLIILLSKLQTCVQQLFLTSIPLSLIYLIIIKIKYNLKKNLWNRNVCQTKCSFSQSVINP